MIDFLYCPTDGRGTQAVLRETFFGDFGSGFETGKDGNVRQEDKNEEQPDYSMRRNLNLLLPYLLPSDEHQD